MTDAKHTPGPWAVEEDFNDGEELVGFNIISVPSGNEVVSNEGISGNSDEDRANARLIAAAPDLLAALKSSIALADANVARFDGHPIRTDECAALYEHCVSVIKKAEGRA